MNDREKDHELHTMLAHAVDAGDDKLAARLRKEINAGPVLPGLSDQMLDSLSRGPDHTCCAGCRNG